MKPAVLVFFFAGASGLAVGSGSAFPARRGALRAVLLAAEPPAPPPPPSFRSAGGGGGGEGEGGWERLQELFGSIVARCVLPALRAVRRFPPLLPAALLVLVRPFRRAVRTQKNVMPIILRLKLFERQRFESEEARLAARDALDEVLAQRFADALDADGARARELRAALPRWRARASRGSLGALSAREASTVRALRAAAKDYVGGLVLARELRAKGSRAWRRYCVTNNDTGEFEFFPEVRGGQSDARASYT